MYGGVQLQHAMQSPSASNSIDMIHKADTTVNNKAHMISWTYRNHNIIEISQ